MKTRIACFLFASLILCAGCGKTDRPVSDVSETTTKATTTEIIYEEVITCTEFDNYDDFVSAMTAEYPAVSIYSPPQDCLSSWTLNNIIMDTGYYQYHFYDAENGRTIMIQICFNEQYETIQERIDELAPNSTVDSEIVVLESDYAVEYYPEDNDYALYGLTGTNNTFYAVVIWNDNGDLDTKDDLLSLRQTLEL